ncbi:1-aminocyclopropane-1-carboxylate deaminase [Alteromonadaceae bacterium 2753L.S.0a.02]|nr:1-aminocyclopropane-1-carboxylate deaminase [Alteromonadaceae bacterium 2753L.S.0a.02]
MAKTSSWLAANLHDFITGSHFTTNLLQLLHENCPLVRVATETVHLSGIDLYLLRLDSLCPSLGGNKIFKLFGHLRDYLEKGYELPVASFGGAHSNHLYALAHACHILGLPCVGFIRGEPSITPSATLADLDALGMQLRFVRRSEYRLKEQLSWRQTQGNFYWIPEGGGGPRGVLGCIEIGRFLAAQAPSAVALACGTGSTLAGIHLGLGDTPVLGVSALKGAKKSLENAISNWDSQVAMETLPNGVQNFKVCPQAFTIADEFHCGGFARYPGYLAEFVSAFEADTGILLDPVYTSKLLWGVAALARRGHWSEGAKVIAVHTGGLQGRRGRNLEYLSGAN